MGHSIQPRFLKTLAPLAQLVERATVNREAIGSKPIWSEQINYQINYYIIKN